MLLEKKRIFNRISINPTYGCWTWEGKKINHNYKPIGLLYTENEEWFAHYYSYYSFVSKHIPYNSSIIQTCGNSLCVNPEHLEMVGFKDLYVSIQNTMRIKELTEQGLSIEGIYHKIKIPRDLISDTIDNKTWNNLELYGYLPKILPGF